MQISWDSFQLSSVITSCINLCFPCVFNGICQTLVKKKTTFFGGDSITMIDYMMWPWFERMEIMELKQYVFIYFLLHLLSAQAIEKDIICYGYDILLTI